MLKCNVGDLARHVGADLGTSRWVAVEQDRIDTFAEVTGDRQWIHVDPDRARTGPFGGTIAHGYLTLSLVSAALLELLAVDDATSAINYGLEKVRFPSPVPVGSKIRGSGQLVDAVELAGAVQTVVRVTMEVDGSERPACVADVVTRWLA